MTKDLYTLSISSRQLTISTSNLEKFREDIHDHLIASNDMTREDFYNLLNIPITDVILCGQTFEHDHKYQNNDNAYTLFECLDDYLGELLDFNGTPDSKDVVAFVRNPVTHYLIGDEFEIYHSIDSYIDMIVQCCKDELPYYHVEHDFFSPSKVKKALKANNKVYYSNKLGFIIIYYED